MRHLSPSLLPSSTNSNTADASPRLSNHEATRLDELAGVVRGFCFEPSGSASSSVVEAAAEATLQKPTRV